MVRGMMSPPRARSLYAAMEEASSPRVEKTLVFSSSDNDEKQGEEKHENQNCNGTDSSNASAKNGRVVSSQRSYRYRTRRIERMIIYEKKKLSYEWSTLHSPHKTPQRRASSEQRTPSSHQRFDGVKRYSRSVSPPCASPATLLSHNLGSKLLMTSPVESRQQAQSKVLLKQLFIADSTDLQTIRWLGTGVSADVYKARDPKSGEFFAVKKSKHGLRNKRERDLRTQEIVALEKLQSSSSNFDHIVRYYQAWQENGFFFLQMEFCGGGTLQDFIAMRNEDVPEKYVWIIIRDVASGLIVLHEHEIVHLDIKPDNIFITDDGKFKIGDFGMASKVIISTKSSSRMGEREGDAKYIAKELLSSASRLPSADIFCLGIMMLEVATRVTLPEAGKDWHNLRRGKLPPLPSTYTDTLSRLIRQMMHPDASKRPSAAEILDTSRKQIDSRPATLILEHVLKQKLVVPAKVRNTNRSARNGLQTPYKNRAINKY